MGLQLEAFSNYVYHAGHKPLFDSGSSRGCISLFDLRRDRSGVFLYTTGVKLGSYRTETRNTLNVSIDTQAGTFKDFLPGDRMTPAA